MKLKRPRRKKITMLS